MSYHHLTMDERNVIYRMQWQGYRQAEIARGLGDAEATRIYAEAYSTAPEFYAFMRSLEAYEKTIGEHTTLVLSPKSEFFRFFDRADPEPPGE